MLLSQGSKFEGRQTRENIKGVYIALHFLRLILNKHFVCDLSLIFFQPISLGLFRSDYLIDTAGGLRPECCTSWGNEPAERDGPIYIKQVEMNTISIGGITFSCLVPGMHR